MRRVTRQRKGIKQQKKLEPAVPNERELVVHALRMSGMSKRAIADALRLSKRTIDYDLQTLRTYLENSPLYRKLWRKVHYDYLKKVEQVFERYLAGRGREDGGDLRLAIRLAENMGILARQSGIEINNPAGDVNFVELQQQRVLSLRNALLQFGVKVKEIIPGEVREK
ncbi:MAG: hypothetical protein AB1690_02495 [Candidatus Zixiibacteriota bacterium]